MKLFTYSINRVPQTTQLLGIDTETGMQVKILVFNCLIIPILFFLGRFLAKLFVEGKHVDLFFIFSPSIHVGGKLGLSDSFIRKEIKKNPINLPYLISSSHLKFRVHNKKECQALVFDNHFSNQLIPNGFGYSQNSTKIGSKWLPLNKQKKSKKHRAPKLVLDSFYT